MAQNNFDNFKSDVDHLVERILFDTADAMIAYIDSSDIIPVDTHNLKDSTGVGVYHNGVLKKFTMPRRAEEARIIGGVAIWGEDMIDQLLDAGISRYGIGDHLVLMSTMPYAEDVDEGYRNAGFFNDVLSTEFEVILDEVVKNYGSKKL
jgi:hypothetical protein